MEKAAAFLETRRYVGYVGGTTEVSRYEGHDLDEAKRILYITLTIVDGGMKDKDDNYDAGTLLPAGLPHCLPAASVHP